MNLKKKKKGEGLTFFFYIGANLFLFKELFEHATALAPGDPIKFQCPPAPPAKKISPMEQIIKKKTIR